MKTIFQRLLPAFLLFCSSNLSAVMVDPAGRGEVLLLPYYSVNGGQQTLLSVVNHTNTGKAVKVRFREGRNGREVYAFNLYLAEFDVWTGALFAAGDRGEARLLTQDNTCTVPAIKTSSTLPQLPNGTRYAALHNLDYSGARADDGPADLARSRDGYIEMIEMGTLVNNSDFDFAATHVGGVPRECEALVSAWEANGVWTIDPGKDLLPPSGQMSGAISIIDVQGGALYSMPATALSRFSLVAQHSGPAAPLPDLSSAVTELARVKVQSTVIADGKLYHSEWPQARAFDAVTAALMTADIRNEFNVDTAISASSDWALTFPTRRFYTASADAAETQPFRTLYPGTELQRTGCVSRESIGEYRTYDRETRRPVGTFEFTGSQPPVRTYCRAAQVFNIGSSESLLADAASEQIQTGLSGAIRTGWLHLSFKESQRTRPALSGETYGGVPAIGFWALRYRNAAARPGELGIYSSVVPHQRSVDCKDALGQPCASL